MDDRHYIAKLERMLEERKDIINTLTTICEDLVEERDKLSDYADRCLRDRVNESELLRMEQERSAALVKERDELTKQLDSCETDYESMRDYADKCHADNVHTHELLERQSEDFDELYADREDLKNKYELVTENFDELLSDYHCLDQRFCTEVRDHQEAQHKIKRLEGMVERRDKKIKDLTVERDNIKDACENCNCVNELLAENKELKKKIKDLNTKSDYLQGVIDSMTETDNDMLFKRDAKIHELAIECENLRKDLEVAKHYDSVCFGCSITESLADENKHLREEVKYLNAIVDGAS